MLTPFAKAFARAGSNGKAWLNVIAVIAMTCIVSDGPFGLYLIATASLLVNTMPMGDQVS
ncbi:MAG: hypothetical protein MI750_06630 [Xanthomonadales bacterium]|nr:hypothetical protein [Xanthomonadales bacterium]